MAKRQSKRYENDEKLIESVRSYDCLWNTLLPAFKNQRTKDNAWRCIGKEYVSSRREKIRKYIVLINRELPTEAFVRYELDRDPKACQTKFKNLRDTFVKELKKTKCPKSEDLAPEYKSQWAHYSSMLFLKDCVRHRVHDVTRLSDSHMEVDKYKSEVFDDHSSEALLTTYLPSDEQSPGPASIRSKSPSSPSFTLPDQSDTPSTLPKKRKALEIKGEETNQYLLETLQGVQDVVKNGLLNKCDPDESFCYEIACRLKKMTPRQNALAKLQIQSIMYSIEFGPTSAPPTTLLELSKMTNCASLE